MKNGVTPGDGATDASVDPNLSSVFHKFGDVFYPTPTPALPLNGREISPFKGEGRRGMGYVSE